MIIPLEELRRAAFGHGWVEYRPDPEDPPTIPPEEYLMECVWMGNDALLRDTRDATSTGLWISEDAGRYGSFWRVWTEKPSIKKRKEIPWKEADT